VAVVAILEAVFLAVQEAALELLLVLEQLELLDKETMAVALLQLQAYLHTLTAVAVALEQRVEILVEEFMLELEAQV
jgi:hypothetical protein